MALENDGATPDVDQVIDTATPDTQAPEAPVSIFVSVSCPWPAGVGSSRLIDLRPQARTESLVHEMHHPMSRGAWSRKKS